MKEGDLVTQVPNQTADIMTIIEYVKGDQDIGEEDTVHCELANGSHDWFRANEVWRVR
jgi:hypothetical protein